MKQIAIIFFFIPLFGESQTIHKRTENYWDKKLNKSVCCDSVFNVNGWLDAGDNDKGDTRYPYLQFSLVNYKKTGVYIEFDGQCTGNKYASTSDIDTVEVEFENHEKIKFTSVSNGIQVLGFSPNYKFLNAASFADRIQLSEKDFKIFMTNPIYKISFLSSKNVNVQGEFFVRTKYKDEIKNCIAILLK